MLLVGPSVFLLSALGSEKMAYTALYRKLRPKTFDEVLGQDHIVKTLKNQLRSGRVSHAYLFCGTRGTGKTSAAKIFAKAINCIAPVNGEPCNNCHMCHKADENRSFNIFEIDAASNNGVDNIRELRDEVSYPPAEGKYKVYIIDEVHMLSLAAFNALLKTLEEPPEHIVFILATTDPQKVPVTILSRCQRFDFRRIAPNVICKALKSYMEAENVSITDDAVKAISGVCDGAMRDALSILDRCISFYYGEEITRDKVLSVIGSADKSVFFELADFICDFDTVGALSVISGSFEEGRDIRRFVSEFVVHLRNLLLMKASEDISGAFDYSAENIERLRSQSRRMETDRLIELISEFSELLNRIRTSENTKIITEVFIVRITRPVYDENSSLLARIEQLEKMSEMFAVNNFTPERLIINEKPVTEEKAAAEIPENIPKAVPEDMKNTADRFDEFAKSFDDKILYMFLQRVKPGWINGEKLYFVCSDPSVFDYLHRKKQLIDEKLAEFFEKRFDAELILKEDYDRRHMAVYGRKDEDVHKADKINDDESNAVKEAIPDINIYD